MTHRNDFDLAQLPAMQARIEADYSSFRASQQAVLAAMNERYAASGMVQRPCPLCDADEYVKRFRKAGLDIVTCRHCGMEYSRNVLREELDRAYYAQDPTGFLPALEQLRQHPVYRELDLRRADYIVDLLGRQGLAPDASLLDIGSGHGALLEVACNRGLRAEGIELSPAIAEDCRRRGLKVRTAGFPEALAPGERFGSIVLLDVLEHLVEPRPALRELAARLQPGGLLAVQVPNMASLLIAIEGEHNSNYGYGHWSYFTPTTLSRLMTDNGFRVLHMETYVSELHRVQRKPDADVHNALVALGHPDLTASSMTADSIFSRNMGYKLFLIATPN